MVRASLAIATLIAAAPAPVTRAGGAPPLGVAAWMPVILLERSGPSSDTSDAHFADTTSAAASEWGPPPRPRRVPRPRPLAGPLVLLYAQPLTRIVTVTTTDVVLAADRVQLRLGSDPLDVSEPFASLLWLREHLLDEGIGVVISRERRCAGSCAPAESPGRPRPPGGPSTDTDSIGKMRRILVLYDHPPVDGRVVCVDESGPWNLLARKGRAWRDRYAESGADRA